MEEKPYVSNEEILHLINDMNFITGKKIDLLAKAYSKPISKFKPYKPYRSTILQPGSFCETGTSKCEKTPEAPQSAEVFNSSLVLTKICKLIMNHFKICTIAGGYPAFMAGDTNDYNDIDFFIPVINGPAIKTLVTRSGQVQTIERKCSCLTFHGIKSLLDKIRSKEGKPLTLHPTSFLKVVKVCSSCDKTNKNKYLLNWNFSPIEFPDYIYDPYYISHIITIFIECLDESKGKLQEFTFQLIFVSSIFITNKIYDFQSKHKNFPANKQFRSFVNNMYGTYVVEFFDLWICKKFIYYDLVSEQFILVEPVHIYETLQEKPLKEMNLYFLYHLQNLTKIYIRHQISLMRKNNIKIICKPHSNIPSQEYDWIELTYPDRSHIHFRPNFMIAPLTSNMIFFRADQKATMKYSLRISKYIKRIQIDSIVNKRNVFKLQKIVFIYILKNVNIYNLYEIYSRYK